MEQPTTISLPSRFELKQVVHVIFIPTHPPIVATVRGIHFYPGKVKYDLGIWLEDSTETRIYNVDSSFVFDPHPQHTQS